MVTHLAHCLATYITGIHGVMDTVIGKGHSDPSSNTGQGHLHFT